MIILFPGNPMHLAWREKMNAAAFDRKRIKIDHVRSCSIDKNAYFIICMAVRLLGFVRIFPVLNGFALYLIYMKGNLFIAFGAVRICGYF